MSQNPVWKNTYGCPSCGVFQGRWGRCLDHIRHCCPLLLQNKSGLQQRCMLGHKLCQVPVTSSANATATAEAGVLEPHIEERVVENAWHSASNPSQPLMDNNSNTVNHHTDGIQLASKLVITNNNNTHLDKIIDKMKYRCPTCAKLFKKWRPFLNHTRECCPDLSQKNRERRMRQRIKFCEKVLLGKNFAVGVCNRHCHVSSSPSNLTVHDKDNASSKEVVITDQNCVVAFSPPRPQSPPSPPSFDSIPANDEEVPLSQDVQVIKITTALEALSGRHELAVSKGRYFDLTDGDSADNSVLNLGETSFSSGMSLPGRISAGIAKAEEEQPSASIVTSYHTVTCCSELAASKGKYIDLIGGDSAETGAVVLKETSSSSGKSVADGTSAGIVKVEKKQPEDSGLIVTNYHTVTSCGEPQTSMGIGFRTTKVVQERQGVVMEADPGVLHLVTTVTELNILGEKLILVLKRDHNHVQAVGLTGIRRSINLFNHSIQKVQHYVDQHAEEVLAFSDLVKQLQELSALVQRIDGLIHSRHDKTLGRCVLKDKSRNQLFSVARMKKLAAKRKRDPCEKTGAEGLSQKRNKQESGVCCPKRKKKFKTEASLAQHHRAKHGSKLESDGTAAAIVVKRNEYSTSSVALDDKVSNSNNANDENQADNNEVRMNSNGHNICNINEDSSLDGKREERDSLNEGNSERIGETSKRTGISNLPAWMTSKAAVDSGAEQMAENCCTKHSNLVSVGNNALFAFNRNETASASASAEFTAVPFRAPTETSQRQGISNLPAWMTGKSGVGMAAQGHSLAAQQHTNTPAAKFIQQYTSYYHYYR